MLAEASIRYLREKRGFASVWNRQKLAAALAVLFRYLREKRGFASVWNRQKLAAALAVLLVLAGYGGWWYAGITHDIEEKPQVVRSAAVQQAEPLRQRNLLSQI